MIPRLRPTTTLEKLEKAETQTDFEDWDDYIKNIEKLASELKQYSGYVFSKEMDLSKLRYTGDWDKEVAKFLKEDNLNGIDRELRFLSAFVKNDLFKKEDSDEARVIKMERWIAVMHASVESNDLLTASIILNELNSPALSKLSKSLPEEAEKIKKENESLLMNEEEIIKRMERNTHVIPPINFLKNVQQKPIDYETIKSSLKNLKKSYLVDETSSWLSVAISEQKSSMGKITVLNKIDRVEIDEERKGQTPNKPSKMDQAEIDKERRRQTLNKLSKMDQAEIDKERRRQTLNKLNKIDRTEIDEERKRQTFNKLSKMDPAEIDKERKRQQRTGFIQSLRGRLPLKGRLPKKRLVQDSSLEVETKVAFKKSPR